MGKIHIANPVEIDERRMTPARRARIIARDRHCKYPGCDIAEGLEIDHIVALELGGRDTDDNLECLCGPHHKVKTAADLRAIAQAKRRQAAHTGNRPPTKRPIRSRGFSPSRPPLSQES